MPGPVPSLDRLPYCERCTGPAPLPSFLHCESGDVVQVHPSRAEIETFQIIACSDVIFSQGLQGSEISVRESRVQMLQKAWCDNELSTAIPRLDGFCFKPLVRFCLLPGLDLVAVLCLLQKQCPREPQEVALVHCKEAFFMAALSHGIFSRELACAAAQEILVAPLLQSLLFGARAGFGLAHILKCLTALKRCCRVSRVAGGAAKLEAGFAQSSCLAQIPAFLLELAAWVFHRNPQG